ncbi:aromatic compound dioxygenase [Aspergillus desertorum]
MTEDHVINFSFLAAALVAAHPGHEEKLATRDLLSYKAHLRRGLDRCARSFEESGLTARAIARRAEVAKKYRARHVLRTRDTDDVLNTDHESSENYTLSTSESEIFASASTCVLNPEGEIGPPWVDGELVRTDIIEDQAGIPVVLDLQFVDVSTCQPIEGIYAETWNCNATAVYSGETFLRGVSETDEDGVVTFKTLFPGHYAGRATHYHVLAHLDATLLENNTLTGGSVPHIGQLFFDQDLITAVEATSPYSFNTIEITTNAEDRMFSTETSGTTSDPVLNYVYLGDSLEDGLLAWTTIAIDLTAEYTPTYSFVWTENGSEAVSGSSSGAGGTGDSGTGGASGP